MRIPVRLCALFVAASLLHGSEKLEGIACRSVHLNYPAPTAVAFYNEVTVEKSAAGTYFCVCGWSKGYFGLQELADGKKLIIFSVWDPPAGDLPEAVAPEQRVKLLHQDEGVRVGRFGHEGTGGQSFFDYAWAVGTPYRFAVTAKPDGNGRTDYGGYFYVPENRAWKHLVTFSTLTPKDDRLRGLYSFVEDFRRNKVSATQERKARFGNGWVKPREGDWTRVARASFSGDANPVLNIDAGESGGLFFLATGGETANVTTKLGETITANVAAPSAPGDLPPEARGE